MSASWLTALALVAAVTAPRTQFVSVDRGVQLEVLDWGGSGRPVVLLAGSGNTAHVFDEFAVKLAGNCCHVYGITRRGYGRSTRPASGYDDQRLADDVLRVLVALRLESPVLIGHSMAGGEMTTLARQNSQRLAGLVYLDALADPGDKTTSDAAFMALYDRLPQALKPGAPPPFPESELKEVLDSDGRYRGPTNAIHEAIGAGQTKRDYAAVRVPILAISAVSCPAPREEQCITRPDDPPRYAGANREERALIAQFDQREAVFFARWKDRVREARAPVRFVNIPRANHYIFLSHEAEVLREIRQFVAQLQVLR